ncbi:MAG: adenylyltransferase/cytidyltransferase family protein [Alphaproteobacteria bacterium]|nr:adenylyltransferase/cytidyltransferase family protein [Alphaproteobacteria bacterium]
MTVMAWFHTFPSPLPLPQGCAAALGNFDGVHAGHRALLQHAQQLAQANGLPLVALTFHPHPRQVLRPHEPFTQLQPLPERVAVLQAAGAEGVAVVPFDSLRAQQSPAAFMQEILVDWLRAKVVVVGENFHFGHRAQGNPATLQANPAFSTVVMPLVGDAQGPYSSSRLRAARATP